METTTRAADLMELNRVLSIQRAQRHDVIQPAAFFRAHEDGTLSILGDDPFITPDGVTPARYVAGDVFSDGISARLGIPRAYLRKMAEKDGALWARNVNAWLQHPDQADKKFLLRGLRDKGAGTAFGRALLTNSFDYGIENLDVLVAALDGVRESGYDVAIDRCDLTERRMYVTMHAPSVDVEAAALLDGYRSPWENEVLNGRRVLTAAQAEQVRQHGDPGSTAGGEGSHRGFYQEGTEPIVFGGLRMKNSDVGCGAYSIEPMFHILRCTNGMTVPISMAKHSLRKTHITARTEAGVVRDSARTVRAKLEKITSETIDAVQHFLSRDFVAGVIAEIEEAAGKPLGDPTETIRVVTRELSVPEDTAADVLSHFIAGGQLTAGGVMQAFTSVAQTLTDGDRAAQMEDQAIHALELAVANA